MYLHKWRLCKKRDTPNGVSLDIYSPNGLLAQCQCYVYSASYCTTYHWVVTDTEEAHHLNVSRYRRRTCELSVRVHTAQRDRKSVV